MDPTKCTRFLALILILLSLPSFYKTEECLQCNTTDSLVESKTKKHSLPKQACRKPVNLEIAYLLYPFPVNYKTQLYPRQQTHITWCLLFGKTNFTLCWKLVILDDYSFRPDIITNTCYKCFTHTYRPIDTYLLGPHQCFLVSNVMPTKAKMKADNFSGQSCRCSNAESVKIRVSPFLNTASEHMAMSNLPSISISHFTSCTKVTWPGHDVTGIVNPFNDVFYIHFGVHK